GRSIDETARKSAAECVSNLCASPLGTELANARTIHREIDFLLKFSPVGAGVPPSGGVPENPPEGGTPTVISGTIDCLFESASGEWIVLDYKTGLRDRSTPPAELLKDYEIQLGLYALAIQQFIGRVPARIELVFIRSGVECVLFDPTAARLADVT